MAGSLAGGMGAERYWPRTFRFGRSVPLWHVKHTFEIGSGSEPRDWLLSAV